MRQTVLVSLLGSGLLTGALAQTWCGKNYKSTQKPAAPGGNFPLPSSSSEPLLALRCAPAIRPYIAADTSCNQSIIIDSPVVYHEIANTKPIQLSNADTTLYVTVSLGGRTLTTGHVPLNATAYELPFSLEGITPQMAAYNLSCKATYAPSSQSFSATTMLSLLPQPTNSSVTKMDLRTGALLAQPATGHGGEYQPVFPIGFYTQFDSYLASNLSVINELKEKGFTIIHPVPPFDNLTALNMVIDRMQEVGLYLMYDMRFTYMNSTSVTQQVNSIKNRPNLLLWYTADEPDGTSDPLNATTIAYDLIYNLDGYHPVSLVLNCQDYYWSSYTAGTDVVMQDVYMVGNNVSWSNKWNTTCTPEYGDCGCDNCVSIPAGDIAAVPPHTPYWGAGSVPANSGIGSYFNIGVRVSSFMNRLEVMGWERTKAVWTVPQAFGGDSGDYWPRMPSANEWLVQTLVGINQGALGVVPWDDPTSTDIKTIASAFANNLLPVIKPYLFNSTSVRKAYVVGGASVATWKGETRTLVLATNTNYRNQTVTWEALGLKGIDATMEFVQGPQIETVQGGFTLDPVGSVAYIVSA